MKIIIVGGTGVLGREVVKLLALKHEVITAARHSGDVKVDITDYNSIEQMYETVGNFDALVSTTGSAHFESIAKSTVQQYQATLNNKLMGQVNLVKIGLKHIKHSGSFTLTSGILNRDPIRLHSSCNG